MKLRFKVIIGFILGLISSIIPYGSYPTSIGNYYTIGFPFKTFQMLGDAGYSTSYNFIFNIIFYIIFILCFMKIYEIINSKYKIK